MSKEERSMKWVTREHPKTDRIACPWLIRTFIEPAAEIVYLPADQVLAFAEREGAISFDAAGARYTHRDGLCSFEVFVEEYRLGSDPALALLARMIHGADVSEDRDVTPQSRPACDRRRLLVPGPARRASARAGAPRLRRALRMGTARDRPAGGLSTWQGAPRLAC
jgi:hypothetical protein